MKPMISSSSADASSSDISASIENIDLPLEADNARDSDMIVDPGSHSSSNEWEEKKQNILIKWFFAKGIMGTKSPLKN